MFTLYTVASLITMAGPEFLWKGIGGAARPSGGARKGGRVRVGMRLWLHAAQEGMCPTCGHAVDALIGSDLSHVVGSGPNRAGWLAGNIFLAHSSCNVGQARLSFEYGNADGETERERLAYIASYSESEGMLTATNESGYRLVLTPADFARSDLIATEWPVRTVGGFIKYDPAYQG